MATQLKAKFFVQTPQIHLESALFLPLPEIVVEREFGDNQYHFLLLTVPPGSSLGRMEAIDNQTLMSFVSGSPLEVGGGNISEVFDYQGV